MIIKKIRRTKIVVTLGPETDKRDNLEKIILSGANILRLNFSHGTREDHENRVYNTYRIIHHLGINIAILGDLQGPKIRIGCFKKNFVYLNIGNTFILDYDLSSRGGTEISVSINYKNLLTDLQVNDVLLLDDGKIQLKIFKIFNKKIFTKVVIGGPLSNNKGINKLGGGLSAPSITEKDRQDIIIAANIGIDYLAVSFPRQPQDLMLVRKLLQKSGSKAKIVTKMERAEVVASSEVMKSMILASDVVMVARGDLGVEIGDSKLIWAQKKLIKYSNRLNRIVITATQMMESMVNNPMPTRAEVMDVANAVLDGTDAVMLSSETASGKYPSETVQFMSRICRGAEKIPSMHTSKHRMNWKFYDIEEVSTMSAMYAANHLFGVRAIISITESGQSVLFMSRINSGLPIFALSKHKNTLNAVSLYRGVTPVYFNTVNGGLEATHDAIVLLLKKNFITHGDIVVVTHGDIMGQVGQTNINRIMRVI